MKKAVITTGSKQYMVREGDELKVDLVKQEGKSLELKPLVVINGANVKIGTPAIDDAKVVIEVVEQEVKAEKVTAIRFKAKKRVRKVRGHRQLQTVIKIKKID